MECKRDCLNRASPFRARSVFLPDPNVPVVVTPVPASQPASEPTNHLGIKIRLAIKNASAVDHTEIRKCRCGVCYIISKYQQIP